jgi:hypothetical protein
VADDGHLSRKNLIQSRHGRAGNGNT